MKLDIIEKGEYKKLGRKTVSGIMFILLLGSMLFFCDYASGR